VNLQTAHNKGSSSVVTKVVQRRERERETAEVQYTATPMRAKKFFAPKLE